MMEQLQDLLTALIPTVQQIYQVSNNLPSNYVHSDSKPSNTNLAMVEEIININKNIIFLIIDLTKEETLYSITQNNTSKLTLVEDLDGILDKRKDTIFITPPNPYKKPKTAPLANKILKILELKRSVVISPIENN